MLRCLGQNEYGLYSLVASVIAYLTLLDFGFGSAIVRYSARAIASGNKQDEWKLYGMFLSGYAVIGIIVTIGGVVLYLNVDRMFGRTMTVEDLYQAKVMMALMVANLALTFPFSLYGSIISAYEKFVFQRVITISRIILSTGVLIAVLALGYKAIALVIVQTIFSIGTLLINYIYCKCKLHIKVSFKNLNFLLLKEIMIFSWWNFLGEIVHRIYWTTGQFVLGIYSGTIAVAIFALSNTITTLYMSLSGAFNSVLLPRLTTLALKEENNTEISNIFIKTGRLQFSVLALILSGFIVFGQPFIKLWAGEGYSQVYIITCLFFIFLLCPLIQNVGATILLARGQMKFRSLAYLVIAVISLTAQILLAKPMGALGCALATVGALFLGQWLTMNYYYKKYQHIDIYSFWSQILKMGGVPFLITVIGYIFVSYLDISNWVQLIISIIIFIGIYIPVYCTFCLNKYEKNLIKGPIHSILSVFKFKSFC